jgi:hypothetical protein
MVLCSKQYAWFPYVNSTFTSVPGPTRFGPFGSKHVGTNVEIF